MGVNDGRVIGTTRILDNGPDNQRFNIVILSEGYQEGDLPRFAEDAQAFLRHLQATPPFDRLMSAFNVHRIDVASTDRGADDPTAAGGTGATANTYFDATFGHGGNRRALVVNDALVVQTANAQVPGWHMLMVIVNSSVYGGTGGSVAVFSLAASAFEIGVHEMGHTAFGLADEYEYWAGCGLDTDRNRHPAGEPSQPNVTTASTRDSLKWKDLVAPATSIPTMQNPNCRDCDGRDSTAPAGTVGAFEGAHYYHCGAFRPEFNCKMRALGQPFCAVCRREIGRALTPFLPGALDDRRAFDPAFYLAFYPDLRAAFGDDLAAARDHWLRHGIAEGRRGCREFDVRTYLATYPDLNAAFGLSYGAALLHWLGQGLVVEGRRGSHEFDVRFYLTAYGDLKAAFGTDYGAALDHWVTQGLPNEGRRGSREFDVQFYLGVHGDLKAAFGTNHVGALDHWIVQGLPNEGRRGSREVDVQFYLARYGDLKAAFGTNYTAALDHWITQGLPNEGRRGAREVDVTFYLGRYGDLKNAFGSDHEAALDHWVTQGLPNEGRTAANEVDVTFYLGHYPDLSAAFKTNYAAALGHWITQGLPHEGRRASPAFDVQFYLTAYADLKAAFGTNYQAAFDHWVCTGVFEGRKGAP